MTTRSKKTAFTLITLAIMALLGLGLLETILRATAKHRRNATFLFGKRWYYLAPVGIPAKMPDITPKPGVYRAYDADLGWSVKPLGRGDDSNLAGKTDPEIYFSNEHGYRCEKATHLKAVERWAGTELPPADDTHYDFVCIGDSFTHGDAVIAEESWPSQLAALRNQTVANLGVGGYGIDQAVMRYDTKNPRCSHVLLGLISGDLERATSLIYNFTNGDSKSKPLYEFSESGATVFNSPALYGKELLTEYQAGERSTFFQRAQFTWNPTLLKHRFLDFSYCVRTARSFPLWRADRSRKSIYQEEGAPLTYCVRILEHLQQLANHRKAKVTLVLLGEANSFRHKSNSERDNWALLKSKLDAAEIRWIDTTPTIYSMFKKEPASVVNAGDGVHYTPEANLRVAEIIAQELVTLP